MRRGEIEGEDQSEKRATYGHGPLSLRATINLIEPDGMRSTRGYHDILNPVQNKCLTPQSVKWFVIANETESKVEGTVTTYN